jgi:proline dehydrogenase
MHTGIRTVSRRLHSTVPNPAAFAHLSTPRLLALAGFYKLCGYDPLVRTATRILTAHERNPNNVLMAPVVFALKAAMKQTVFRLFCGGETLPECATKVGRLYGAQRIKSIIDCSAEEKTSTDAWERDLKSKQDIIQRASAAMHEAMSSVPLKCTALISPQVLEKLCQLRPHGQAICKEELLNQLTAEDKKLFDDGLDRLRKLCVIARKCNVPLLLDAEQSNRQPAIELLSRMLSQEFNRTDSQEGSTNNEPLIYNTYQLYLWRTPEAIDYDIRHASTHRYTFAAKIVRGAYIVTEKQNDIATKTPNLLPFKDSTDCAYNACVEHLLEKIASGKSVYVMLATHNRQSVELAMDTMKSLKLANNDKRVHFAQILGMADYCSNVLAIEGYNVSKLVTFGPFDEVLPWWLRRLVENKVSICCHI